MITMKYYLNYSLVLLDLIVYTTKLTILVLGVGLVGVSMLKVQIFWVLWPW